MLGAVMFGHKSFQPVIEACIRMAEKAAKEPRDVPENDDSALKAQVADMAKAGLEAAYQKADKQERQEKVPSCAMRSMPNWSPKMPAPMSALPFRCV